MSYENIGWMHGAKVEPKPQMFEVVYGDTTLLHAGGIIGGGAAVLKAAITLAPIIYVSDDGKKMIVSFAEEYAPPKMRAAVKVITRRDPEGLALLGWSLALDFMEMATEKSSNIAYLGIKQAILNFDVGKRVMKGGQYDYVFTIPNKAMLLKELIVQFECLKKKKTFTFPLHFGKPSVKRIGGSVESITPMAELVRYE